MMTCLLTQSGMYNQAESNFFSSKTTKKTWKKQGGGEETTKKSLIEVEHINRNLR